MGSNIHGISCTANNYLKQAWNDIKNEYEKNQTYSITLFENTLVCFMRLYNELRRKVNEEDTPCLECESLEKEFEEMQNDNDLSLFMRTLRTNDTQIYSGVSGGITYTIQYVRDIDIVRVSLPGRASESITDFKGYYWYNFMEYIENINACDDVFSEYCFDDENISVQPERINTPGISDLDSDIDLSGISFIQRETNQALGLKYAPVDGDGYCLLRAILVLKQHDYSWALVSYKMQKEVYNEFIKMVDKKTIEALVDTAFYNLREDVKTLFGVDLQSDNQIQGQSSLMSWSFLFFKKQINMDVIFLELATKSKITSTNYLIVTTYFTFAYSFLEEFFFRGFIFTNLNKMGYKKVGYIFSSLLFALYHIGIFKNWFSIELILLCILGLFITGIVFNYVDTKLDNFLNSWAIHSLDNLKIVIIGYIYLFK